MYQHRLHVLQMNFTRLLYTGKDDLLKKNLRPIRRRGLPHRSPSNLPPIPIIPRGQQMIAELNCSNYVGGWPRWRRRRPSSGIPSCGRRTRREWTINAVDRDCACAWRSSVSARKLMLYVQQVGRRDSTPMKRFSNCRRPREVLVCVSVFQPFPDLLTKIAPLCWAVTRIMPEQQYFSQKCPFISVACTPS